jgi:glycosyltransferase involved in cell wall biosynthesis
MARINILFILEATIGGAFKHVLLLVRHLPKEKYNVSVALSHLRYADSIKYARQLEQDGIKVYNIPMKRRVSVPNDLMAFRQIIRLFKTESFDIVHTHSSKAGFLGRLASVFFGFKVVHTPHCFAFQEKKGLSKYTFLLLERFAALFCERIIAVSAGEYDLALRKHIAPVQNICLIRNVIDEKEIVGDESSALRRRLGISSQDRIILGAGRLVKQKGWLKFIEIATEVLKKEERVCFLIAGSGEEGEYLHELICKLGLERKIILTGYLKEIYSLYNIADIFMNTSLWEGLPYVILEAMIMKVPVVATNIPGNQDLITDNENGFLFDLDHHSDAVIILQKLLSDECYRRQIGGRGYEYLKTNSSFSTFLDNHMRLYQSLLDN